MTLRVGSRVRTQLESPVPEVSSFFDNRTGTIIRIEPDNDDLNYYVQLDGTSRRCYYKASELIHLLPVKVTTTRKE